jgi:hypothetical protein
MVTCLLCLGTAARADDATDGAVSGDLAALTDSEIGDRVSFLIERFEAGQTNAKIWQYGFTGGWGLGVVIGTTLAATANGKDERVNGIVTAVKAAIGTTRLALTPLPGRLGAAPILELPDASREDKLARLRAGEEHLLRIDERARERKHWLPHVGNVAINLAGGGVILGLGDATDAAISTAVGIAAGEIMIWTMPWRGESDLADYKGRFETTTPQKPQVSWWLAPRIGGASLEVRF